MARYKGIFKASANYEPQVAAPFDARMLVEAKSDLTTATTWQQANGSIWVYTGMIVAVAADPVESNNGVYVLIDALNYTNELAWRKLADDIELKALSDKVENMEVVSGADIEVGSFDQLPEIGMSGVTYFVTGTQTIYRWSADANEYIAFGGGGSDLEDIKLIHGGDSNG